MVASGMGAVMGDVIPFPAWMAETPPKFRAFDDDVKGQVIILPVVRVERETLKKPMRKIRIEEPA